ncbi:peroxiredoxin-like family protein [Deinococcus sp. Arct2-2]|uniref:peroxiredoxin-like family protein n=1 Tax=Deinococcus sp. Arct2-2 TaxID=2568653 RepID=UPI001454CDBC|nr:peroxiredoxin-like family protein [Deinococcus sp. Arct2-2]
MLIVPALQAVTQAAEQGEPTLLKLSFSDPKLTTALQLFDGHVLGVRSQMLPAWSASLVQHGVPPVAVTEIQQQTSTLFGALSQLIERGYVTRDKVDEIYRERVVAALLPLAWRTGTASSTQFPGAAPPHSLYRYNALESVQAAQQYAAGLGESERALLPSDCFVASPLASTWPGWTESSQRVYHAALRGLTLGEMAERLGQRWDVLTQNVMQLVGAGTLRREDAAALKLVAPRLRAGQLAPDFCLPDLAGGETRLSELRGQPVWLVFNRQSTCAMCNPHNAQIIAVHEQLKQRGVRIITVWGSTLSDLSVGIGHLHPPYPVLADPRDETYDRYGLNMSVAGTLDLRNLPTMLQGFRMMGTKALKSDGELLRMPAEFLIGSDGRIETAHYNSYGTDWLPMEHVLNWSSQRR